MSGRKEYKALTDKNTSHSITIFPSTSNRTKEIHQFTKQVNTIKFRIRKAQEAGKLSGSLHELTTHLDFTGYDKLFSSTDTVVSVMNCNRGTRVSSKIFLTLACAAASPLLLYLAIPSNKPDDSISHFLGQAIYDYVDNFKLWFAIGLGIAGLTAGIILSCCCCSPSEKDDEISDEIRDLLSTITKFDKEMGRCTRKETQLIDELLNPPSAAELKYTP